ncbi:AMP-binding protein [Porticoccus sp.]|uniref:AMP-binding protein n=1 Tax=Porticoccus sp. TaxID=2024853 RepID=UPI003F6A479D
MESTLSSIAESQPLDKLWYRDKVSSLTYGEQRQRQAALLAWCATSGVGQGNVVLVAVRSEREAASLLTALVCIGRPPVIVNPDSPLPEMQPIIERTGISAVIAEDALLEAWQLAALEVPVLRVVPDQPKGSLFNRLLKGRQPSEACNDWPAMAQGTTPMTIDGYDAGQLAYLIFTSGTTSEPKGVRISCRALLAQMAVFISRYGLTADDRLLNGLPLSHADGFIQGPLLAWASGSMVCRPPVFSANTVQAVMDSIYRERITHMIAVPTMLSLMLRLGADFAENLRSPELRMLVCTAGHLEQALWDKFEAVFGVAVLNMYGLSETVSSALFCGPDPLSRKVGTLGLPVNCAVRITDQTGAAVAEGEAGELQLASDQLMEGYQFDEQATAAVLQDGWFRTGDLVRQLPGGHIELVGRLKNLIVSGGRNISPEAVSACLNQYAGVVESIVLGVADKDWGEWVAALVVAEDVLSENTLINWCREHLSEYKVPRRIFLVDALDKGPAGKNLLYSARAQLDLLLAGTGNEGTDGRLDKTVLSLAASSFKRSAADLELTSGPENTVGWDSLAHMELVVALEKQFGIRLSPREIMQIDSLGKAIELCHLKVGQCHSPDT